MCHGSWVPGFKLGWGALPSSFLCRSPFVQVRVSCCGEFEGAYICFLWPCFGISEESLKEWNLFFHATVVGESSQQGLHQSFNLSSLCAAPLSLASGCLNGRPERIAVSDIVVHRGNFSGVFLDIVRFKRGGGVVSYNQILRTLPVGLNLWWMLYCKDRPNMWFV